MLEVQNLVKEYVSASSKVSVLNGITVTIQEGDFVVIMGESGSGKSTFLNCISTLDRPSAGNVLLEGKAITRFDQRQIEDLRLFEYGFIFQDNHLIDHLTIIENVVVARLQYDPNAYERAAQLLEQLGIADLRDRYPYQVSGGEKQRAAIARALMNEPKVLFADEPTASLNPNTAKEIIALLEQLHQGGQTIVMVTHSMQMAAYGTRLLVLIDGVFQEDLDLSNMDKEERLAFLNQKISYLL